MTHKKLSYIVIPLITLGILAMPISPILKNNESGNLALGVGVNVARASVDKSLDFFYKKNMIVITSRQRHRNVCAGFCFA